MTRTAKDGCAAKQRELSPDNGIVIIIVRNGGAPRGSDKKKKGQSKKANLKIAEGKKRTCTHQGAVAGSTGEAQ